MPSFGIKAAVRCGHGLLKRDMALLPIGVAAVLILDLPNVGTSWDDPGRYGALTGAAPVWNALDYFIVLPLFSGWLIMRLIRAHHATQREAESTGPGATDTRPVPRLTVEKGMYLIAVTAIVTVGVLGGLVLLIIPGLILGARWALALIPVIEIGASPKDALRLSNARVQGHTGRVIALVVGLLVVATVVFLVLAGVELPTTRSHVVRSWLAGGIVFGITYVLMSAYLVAAWALLDRADVPPEQV